MELIRPSENWRTHDRILSQPYGLEQPNMTVRPDGSKFPNNGIVNHSDAIQNSLVVITLHISRCPDGRIVHFSYTIPATLLPIKL